MFDYRLYFTGFIAAALMISLFEMFYTGKIFNNIVEDTGFDVDLAYHHWEFFCKSHRFIGSEHYNQSIDYIMGKLATYQRESERNFSFREEITKDFQFTADGVNSIRGFMRTIVVNFSQAGGDESKTLYITAHIDSHNVGPSAYDNAINVASVLELVHSVAHLFEMIDYNLCFIIVGSEELGLDGSMAYVKQHNPRGYILNLDSFGTGKPYVMFTKAKKSSSVIKTFSRIQGVIAATFHNDIMGSGLIKSATDLSVFEKNNMSGAEMLFIGNPAHYHTRLDTIGSHDDLKHEGDILLRFIKSFKMDEKEKNVIALGVSPFIIVVSIDTMKLLIRTGIIICIISVAKSFSIDLFKALGYFLLQFILILIIMGAMASDIDKVNPVSYADNITIASIIIPALFYTMLGFFFSFNKIFPEFHLQVRVLFDLLICVVSINLDTSLLAFIWLIFSLIAMLIQKEKLIYRTVLEIVGFIPTIFSYTLLMRTAIQYTPNLNGILADFLCLFVGLFLSLRIYLSFAHIASSTEKVPSSLTRWCIFVVAAIIVTFLLLKSAPFSENYTIKGSFAYYLFDNMTGIASYAPEGGKRVMKHLSSLTSKAHPAKLFRRATVHLPAMLSISNNDQLPSFISRWPNLTLGVEREFLHISLNNNEQEVEQLYIIVHCNHDNCIRQCNQCESINYVKENKFKFRMTPVTGSVDLEIDPETKVEVMMCFSRHSEKLEEFKSLFPSYVVHYAKNIHVGDTCLINRTIA